MEVAENVGGSAESTNLASVTIVRSKARKMYTTHSILPDYIL